MYSISKYLFWTFFKSFKRLLFNPDAKITADTAEVTGNLTVNGTIIAETALDGEANNLIVNKANINTANITTLTGTSAMVQNINSGDIQQEVSDLDGILTDYYDVPVIFLKKVDDDYQLQITRVNKLN